MKKLIGLGLIILAGSTLNAQDKLVKDQKAIKDMAGCYKVTFNFAETFSPNKDYEKHENYSSWAYEYVKIIEESPKHISLQHLLVVNEGKEPMVIKHWRQDWDYENTDFYMFSKYNPQTHGQEWEYVEKSENDVKGQWSQKVYQVDDSPRYEGSATWVHVDGRSFWENTTDAPLPRREYSKRQDYNVTKRTNRHEITNYGWLHEQDNAKIIRGEFEDKIIVFEKGWNTYEKADDKECEPAIVWWEDNKKIWKTVRNAWQDRYSQKQDLKLWPKKGVKSMYKQFFDLEEGNTKEDVEKIIDEFSKP